MLITSLPEESLICLPPGLINNCIWIALRVFRQSTRSHYSPSGSDCAVSEMMPAYNSQSKRPVCDSQTLLCLYCFNLEANLFILTSSAIFFSPCQVWANGSVKKLRRCCDDSLLLLTYFDFTFWCTLCSLGIFDVTVGNSGCCQAFRRCSLCVSASTWGAQRVSVRTAWSMHAC